MARFFMFQERSGAAGRFFAGSSPQHVLDKQYGFLHKDMQNVLIFPHKRK